MSATTFCTLAKTGGSKPRPICRFMFAGGQLDGNKYSDKVEILDASGCYNAASADPNKCMVMGSPLTMTTARSSLSVSSFVGSGNVGGGAAMFAGGKTEVKNAVGKAMPVPWSTSDYYISAGGSGPITDLAWFNLSTPRFDLAGIGFDVSGSGGKQQALFAGGTYADLSTSDVVDAFTFDGAIPDVYTLTMSQSRTRPQLGQLGNRFAIVAGGSTCAEWQQLDPTIPNSPNEYFCCGSTNIDVFDLQGASSTTPAQSYLTNLPAQDPSTCTFTQAGSNCGVCDLASASVDGWYVMAGGQYSLNHSDPNRVRCASVSVFSLASDSPAPPPPIPVSWKFHWLQSTLCSTASCTSAHNRLFRINSFLQVHVCSSFPCGPAFKPRQQQQCSRRSIQRRRHSCGCNIFPHLGRQFVWRLFLLP
jgi:hypothetical protein